MPVSQRTLHCRCMPITSLHDKITARLCCRHIWGYELDVKPADLGDHVDRRFTLLISHHITTSCLKLVDQLPQQTASSGSSGVLCSWIQFASRCVKQSPAPARLEYILRCKFQSL